MNYKNPLLIVSFLIMLVAPVAFAVQLTAFSTILKVVCGIGYFAAEAMFVWLLVRAPDAYSRVSILIGFVTTTYTLYGYLSQ